jgi:hypothetical protein
MHIGSATVETSTRWISPLLLTLLSRSRILLGLWLLCLLLPWLLRLLLPWLLGLLGLLLTRLLSLLMTLLLLR